MIFLEIIIILLVLAALYCGYQLLRNEQVYKIKLGWIYNRDPRNDKYSYDYMFWPSSSNFFGLQWPKDKNFK